MKADFSSDPLLYIFLYVSVFVAMFVSVYGYLSVTVYGHSRVWSCVRVCVRVRFCICGRVCVHVRFCVCNCSRFGCVPATVSVSIRLCVCGRVRAVADLVVSDVRVERGDQHERLAHDLADLRRVGADADGAVLVERLAPVTWDTASIQNLHSFNLEITLSFKL